MRATVHPSPLKGTVCVPPSKSMAHRAIIMASLAKGTSIIENIELSEDMQATIGAMKVLGARIEIEDGSLTIEGLCTDYHEENTTIDCGESGSTLRFLIPLCMALRKHTTFTGRGRLLDRSQTVYKGIFGDNFTHEHGKIIASGGIKAGEFTLRGDVSSQFITGLLLVLPLLDGDSKIHISEPFESRSYVDLTLQVMADFGVAACFSNENTITLRGNQQYKAANYSVERDYSQLAFFAVLGAINGEIKAENMRLDSLQGDHAILNIIDHFAGEPWRSVEISTIAMKQTLLSGHDIDLSDCPDLGPILMVLAAFAVGSTTIYNAGRLRLKESDRIAAMESELTKLGVDITSTADTVTISGRREMNGTVTVCTHNDHRIAMSLAVFAACSHTIVTIEDAECVNKSYPRFFEDLRAVGVRVEIE